MALLLHAVWMALVTAPTIAVATLPAPPGPQSRITLTGLGAHTDAPKVEAAQAHLDIGDAPGALAALTDAQGGAAALLRARALLSQNDTSAALRELAKARQQPGLRPLLDALEGRILILQHDAARAVTLLQPHVVAGGPQAAALVLLFASALAQADPARLIGLFQSLQPALPQAGPEARGALLMLRAQAEDKLGQTAQAKATRLQCYLEEPVSRHCLSAPPEGSPIAPDQALDRIERLLGAHRNERALGELGNLGEAGFGDNPNDQPRLCRRAFLHGTAARKLRRYATAETQLSYVLDHCKGDADLSRRAAFVRAKIISIRDGLRAIPAIDSFAEANAGHSMVDDVLFWAGDMYQRRNMQVEAARYYQRIAEVEQNEDFCVEARFRLAWMAYRKDDMPAAEVAFGSLLAPQRCRVPALERARAAYWLARVQERQNNKAAAMATYRQVIEIQALTFYAQAALPRLQRLVDDQTRADLAKAWHAPKPQKAPPLCLGDVAADDNLRTGLNLLWLGLYRDAALFLRAVRPPAGDGTFTAASLASCGPAQAHLLLVLLLQQAHAEHDAFARLRRYFGDEFAASGEPLQMLLWRTAYPLAFRDALQKSETEHALPPLFLQALAREESTFDPQVVSWAEAYGLTQVIFSSAQIAARLCRPAVSLQAPEQLLEPTLNARLGGALLRSMLRKNRGNAGLALIAYNAGDQVAKNFFRNHGREDFVAFCEDINISETRNYVKRVLRTFGAYRWLYDDALPVLQVDETLPAYD